MEARTKLMWFIMDNMGTDYEVHYHDEGIGADILYFNGDNKIIYLIEDYDISVVDDNYLKLYSIQGYEWVMYHNEDITQGAIK